VIFGRDHVDAHQGRFHPGNGRIHQSPQVGRNFLTGARGKHHRPTSAAERKPAVRTKAEPIASGHSLSLVAHLDRSKPAIDGRMWRLWFTTFQNWVLA